MAKKQMDSLTRDALAAQAAGMSYGKYKGLQHARAGQQQAAPAPKKSTRKTFDLICEQCGGAFVAYSARKKYCCDACKKKHDNEAWKETHPQGNKAEQPAATPLPPLPPLGGIHDYDYKQED